jgi:hypothetical protein
MNRLSILLAKAKTKLYFGSLKFKHMKRIALTICSATLLLISCNNSGDTKENKTDTSANSTMSSTTTEPKKDEPWVPVDSATEMKAMMDYATPGDMQKMLAASNGTWNEETTWWHNEGAPAQKSTGTAVNTMIMGGRYQSSKHTGTMMGMPFEGQSIVGYDNAKKKFVSSWIDNWGTGIMMMEGMWDNGTKSITMTGTMPDVCRPGKTCTMKEVLTMVDDNTQKMEMYGPDPKTGKEFKTMEMTLTRKK